MNRRNLHSADLTNCSILFLPFLLIGLLALGCQSAKRFSSSNTQKTKSGNIEIQENSHNGESQFSSFDNVSQNPTRQLIINNAMMELGTPYCYGGEGGESCFDCSGFVNAIYESIGINLPRVSRDIFQEGAEVSRFEAEPGDLVFFKSGGRVNHLGIYLGGQKMIHASTSKGVIIQSLDAVYYKKRFAGFRKYLK